MENYNDYIKYNKEFLSLRNIKKNMDENKEIIITIDLFKNYRTRYFSVMALKGLNISIKKETIAAIEGPSGCGKTTLLNLIGGRDSISSGTVLLNLGEKIYNFFSLSLDEKISLAKTSIGFIYQDYRLVPFCTVYENLEIPLLLKKIKKTNRIKKIKEILEYLDLQDKSNYYPSQLSGGQQQRVAIGAAIIKNPILILADEPTGELDTGNKIRIMNLFKDIVRKLGSTIILTTHDKEVSRLCHSRHYIRDGVILDE